MSDTKLGYLLQVTNEGQVRLDLCGYAALSLQNAKDEAQTLFEEDTDEETLLEWVEVPSPGPGTPTRWIAEFGHPDYPAAYVITACSIEIEG